LIHAVLFLRLNVINIKNPQIRSMAPDPVNRYVFTHKFSDFEDLAEGIRAWDLDFRQLDPGDSPAELTQIGYAGFQLAHACFNRRYDQRGSAPSGTRTFALLEKEVSGVMWCGRPVTDQTLLMFDPSGSFEAVSQPGFRVFTFALPAETLAETAQTLGVSGSKQLLTNSDHAINLTPSAACSLRQHMAQLKQLATLDPTILDNLQYINELECALPGKLIKAITLSNGTPKRPGMRARHLALKKAVDYINTSLGKVINVSDLCRITGVSERTLEYAFTEHYGISPKRFLMNTRLNAVHQTLARAIPGEVTVTDVANEFGYWHMGQFAADYRRLFGKLPSETLSKS
jgi:AraC family ethanolamine operon transcriptional activator